MIKYKIISCFLAVLMLFSLVGCNKNEDAYIYFELPHLPATLDPQTAQSDSELLIVKNIYEGLLRKNEKGEIVCGAAESYKQDGLTYTFTIRKDAKWNNGDDVTAYDFVYAFKRAVNPKTKAPFASRLYSIKNAEKIHKGKLSLNKLGIQAVSDKILKIELSYKDNLFFENLTTSIAMPCNEKFFNESAGKYGLFRENITGNGSYRLTKWNKESFGIRLYRNDGYTGNFKAKNAAVFLTCNDDEPVTEKLKNNSIDMAFIDTAKSTEMKSEGFGIKEYENICWVLTISNDFSYEMRRALMKLVGKNVYSESLQSGYKPANSLFPAVLNKKASTKGITSYNLEDGKRIYTNEIKKLENNKFPANIILYYYDDGFTKPMVTDIVGHWQSNLSAFVNIESASSPELLLSELKNQKLTMAIFPIKAGSKSVSEYLANFGINYKNQNLSSLQGELLESKNIMPLIFQNTTLCYSSAIKEIYTVPGDGFIDFSLIIKEN